MFSFSENHLLIRTPLFMLWVAYGAKEYNWDRLFWGWEFWWKRKKPLNEGDLLFVKRYRHEFRTYSHRDYIRFGGPPL